MLYFVKIIHGESNMRRIKRVICSALVALLLLSSIPVHASEMQDDRINWDEIINLDCATTTAYNFLYHTPFSRDGIITHLAFNWFSLEDATYAVDGLDACWYYQAVRSAKMYLALPAICNRRILNILIYFDGFTLEQAVYGITAIRL